MPPAWRVAPNDSSLAGSRGIETSKRLGVLITRAAIVAGSLVDLLVPKKHFRIIAGILAANAIIATLALAGVEVAETLVGWFACFSFLAGVAALPAVIDD